MSKKVFVGMSGGVDSSVAAALLLEKGYQVEGITMVLSPDDDGSAVKDAEEVAKKLGIPLHIADFKKEFSKNVIDYFVAEYRRGRTPNPCVVCNQTVKFGLLLDMAMELGGDYIATGHYAKIEHAFGRYLLKKSAGSKDQTYFLNRLNQRQLAHALFPIHEYEKSDTRLLAEKLGLPVAHKADSQEICFIPDNDYARFIRDYTKEEPIGGNFVDLQGNKLGEHKGIIHYTVGQRKGLGISFGEPMYVTAVNAGTNEVTLAPEGFQYSKELIAEDMNYISLDEPISCEIEADVKIRCKAAPARARIVPVSESAVRVIFDEPQRAVTPGQAAVLYDGDTVIGGGFIS